MLSPYSIKQEYKSEMEGVRGERNSKGLIPYISQMRTVSTVGRGGWERERQKGRDIERRKRERERLNRETKLSGPRGEGRPQVLLGW